MLTGDHICYSLSTSTIHRGRFRRPSNVLTLDYWRLPTAVQTWFHQIANLPDCDSPALGDGDRAFLVAAARVWNSLPQHVTSAQSLPVFRSRLKTHIFRRCFPWLCCCAWEVTSSFSDTLIVVVTYLLGWIVWYWYRVRFTPYCNRLHS